jgi:NagD protein
MNTTRSPRDFSGYVFDLDGTLYLGEALIPGAAKAVQSLRDAGKRVAFMSNKALGRAADYAAKLTRLGLPATPDEVLNSAVALRLFLHRERPGARVLALGEAPVLEELRAGGFMLTDEPAEAEVVVVSWDRQVTYARLDLALQALRRGAYFVATNPDVTCPGPGGGECLDAGSFIALLEAASGRPVEAVVGKPSPLMLEVILEQWELPAEACLVVGDRLETDLELGRRAGAATAVVLTGVTTRARLATWPHPPDFVLESVAELLPA